MAHSYVVAFADERAAGVRLDSGELGGGLAVQVWRLLDAKAAAGADRGEGGPGR